MNHVHPLLLCSPQSSWRDIHGHTSLHDSVINSVETPRERRRKGIPGSGHSMDKFGEV